MKKLFLSVVCVSFIALLSVQAGYVLTLQQVGPDVVGTGVGALDPTALGFFANVSTYAYTYPVGAVIQIGSSGNASEYGFGFGAPMTGPTSFGSGGLINPADSSSGDFVGVSGVSGALDVPAGYVPDTPLADAATWNNQTFSSMGLTAGIYEWTWGNGVDQNYTLTIGEVPEPSTMITPALAAIFLLVGAGRRWVVKANLAGQ